MNRLFVAIIAFPVLALASACVTDLSARVAPEASLGKDLSYYVVQQGADKRGVNAIICDQLNARGRSATTGTWEAVPDNLDVLVTYVDKWVRDMSMYLLSLDISFRDPRTEKEIAGGYSMRTSAARKDTNWHVNAILTEVFAKTNPEEASPVDPEDNVQE